MHIAMYTPAWPANKHSNGIITYVQHMRTELMRQGHRVSVLTGVVDDEDIGPDIHRVSTRPDFAGRIRRKLAAHLPGLVTDNQTWGHLIGNHVLEIHRSNKIDVVEIE